MKKPLVLVGLLLIVSVSAFAQRGVPTFNQYRVRAEKIMSKPVDLASHKNARMFRTNLRNAAKEGVNFAGHYILTTWGCGTGCNEGAIIDAKTGRVFFPKELQGIGVAQNEWSYSLDTLEFKPTSALLKLNGMPGGISHDNVPEGEYYYQWTGTALKKIKFIKKTK